jgi:hypothetical protein
MVASPYNNPTRVDLVLTSPAPLVKFPSGAQSMTRILVERVAGEWQQVEVSGQREASLQRLLDEISKNDNGRASKPRMVRVEMVETRDFSCPCFGAPDDPE